MGLLTNLCLILLALVVPMQLAAQSDDTRPLSAEIVHIVVDSLREISELEGTVSVRAELLKLGSEVPAGTLDATILAGLDSISLQDSLSHECDDEPGTCRMLGRRAVVVQFSVPTVVDNELVVRVDLVFGSTSRRTPVAFAGFDMVFEVDDTQMIRIVPRYRT